MDGRLRNLAQFPYRDDARTGPLAQLVSLPLDAGEGSAGLLAGHHLGHFFERQRRFDQVCRLEMCVRHDGSQSWERSGNGRTGSRPSQPSEASLISWNILPFGPATSDSSITAPGWY